MDWKFHVRLSIMQPIVFTLDSTDVDKHIYIQTINRSHFIHYSVFMTFRFVQNKIPFLSSLFAKNIKKRLKEIELLK